MREVYIPAFSFIVTLFEYNTGNLQSAAVFAVGTMFSLIMCIDDDAQIEP